MSVDKLQTADTSGPLSFMMPRSRRRVTGFAVASSAVLFGLAVVQYGLPLPISELSPAAGLAVTAATPDTYTVTSPIVLSGEPRVVLQRGNVSVAGAGPGAGQGSAAIQAALAKRNAALTLDGGELWLKEATPDASGEGGSSAEDTAPLVAALGALKFKSLALRNTSVTIEGAGGGIARFTITAADITRTQGEGFDAKGEARLRDQPFAFETSLKTAAGKNELGMPLTLSAKSPVLDVAIDGHVRLAGRLQITAGKAEVASSDVGALMRLASIAWPQSTGIKAFRAQGPFSWSGGIASFENAECEIDGNAATGNLALDTGGARPAIEATLAFEDLKLDPYLARDSQQGIAAQIAKALSMVPLTGLVRSSDGIPLEAADADVRISADNVSRDGMDLGRVAASLTLKEGALVADFTEIMLPSGGTGNAQISTGLGQGEPSYAMRLNLEHVALDTLTEQVFGAALLEGRGALKADLGADTLAANDVIKHMKGKISIVAEDRVRAAGNLERLLSAASRSPAEGWQNGAGRMPLDDLSAHLTLSAGTLGAEQVTARAGDMHLQAQGSVSLVNKTLDVVLTRSPDPAVAGAGPLRGDVLELRGAWSHPSIRTASPLPAALRSDAGSPP